MGKILRKSLNIKSFILFLLYGLFKKNVIEINSYMSISCVAERLYFQIYQVNNQKK